ncbi:MAG TPA: nucleotidyltransferase family protein [Polyangiaceae bacterium]|jgi:molybdenum cofactor cytidylyltransferase|nr:nucleotidyltransferase family protein [Polyangiaceae bacterium]
MNPHVSCAVLAAGASRRLGHPKQLARHRGAPLVRLAAECVRKSRASAAAVIVGADADSVRSALGNAPVEVLMNPDWQRGMASSIHVAVAWAELQQSDALLLTLCDQPHLSAAHLDRLITEFEHSELPVASYYAGRNAVPALFPRSLFGSLSELSGDSGARRVLNDGRPLRRISWPEGEFDVDTHESERKLIP